LTHTRTNARTHVRTHAQTILIRIQTRGSKQVEDLAIGRQLIPHMRNLAVTTRCG